MWGCRGWQAARTWVSVSPEMVGFPAPIGPPGASQQAPKREQREHEEKRKSPRAPKFEQKPATNRLRIPYKFG